MTVYSLKNENLFCRSAYSIKKQISLGCRGLSAFESSLGCSQHSAKTSQKKSFKMNKNGYRLALIVVLAQADVASCFISKYYDAFRNFCFRIPTQTFF